MKLDPSQENIDQFCNKLCDVFIETAKKIDVCKIKESPNSKSKHKVTTVKPWFDNECKHERDEYMRVKNKLNKIKSVDPALPLKETWKRYKKFIKTKNKVYHKQLSNRLRTLKSNNAKEFWDILGSNKFIGLIFSKFVYIENIDRDVILLRDNVVTRSGRAVIRPTRLDL